MSPQIFKSRVTVGATILMVGTIGYLIHYTYSSFHRAFRFCFGEPERWQNHWRVEETAVIEMSTRMTYFAIWISVVLLSIAGTLVALHLLNRVRRGHIFDAPNSRILQWAGAVLVLAMLADTVFGSVELYLITSHNTVTIEPIRFAFDASDMKVMVLGIVLFMFGWVLRDTIELDQIHRGFV